MSPAKVRGVISHSTTMLTSVVLSAHIIPYSVMSGEKSGNKVNSVSPEYIFTVTELTLFMVAVPSSEFLGIHSIWKLLYKRLGILLVHKELNYRLF